jgi:cytochrome oxidase Cu insertion factor (SCO1/SenC/PrrC family)
MIFRVPRSVLAAGMILALVLAVAGDWFAWRNRQPMAGMILEQLGGYGQVPRFTLTERSGRRIGLDDLLGLVWVADFIYTQCTESCPLQSLERASSCTARASSPATGSSTATSRCTWRAA